MLAAGTRERWLAALLIVVLAAPIVGITLYFFNNVQQRIAFAQRERGGLAQLSRLERFQAAAIAYGNAIACPNSTASFDQLRRTADEELRQVEMLANEGSKPITMSSIHSSWQDLRLSTDPHTDFSPLFDALTAAFVSISDDSGLTFDPEIEGLDIGDSLAYRLPRAVDLFASTQRSLCANSNAMTLDERFQLAIDNAQGAERAMDAFQDIDDALQRGDPTTLLDVSRAYARSRDLLDSTTRSVREYITGGTQQGRVPATSALEQMETSLEALMTTETPTIENRIEKRIGGLETERLLYLIPGILGLVAAIAMVLLMLRVLYAGARLRAVEQAAAEHERSAMHDSLTGLLNRRAFHLAMQNAAANGPSLGVLCLVDLDDFKAVNDTYGHLTGDEVLKRTSRIIEGAIRSTDVAARIGGDEFAMFLRSPIDRQGVERVVATIARDARTRAYLRGNLIKSSVSIGAATIFGRGSESIDEAFSLADAALYEAKRTNRGSVSFADEVQA
jgi:diguanylate cyclase (GGDEF)-like protein